MDLQAAFDFPDARGDGLNNRHLQFAFDWRDQGQRERSTTSMVGAILHVRAVVATDTLELAASELTASDAVRDRPTGLVRDRD